MASFQFDQAEGLRRMLGASGGSRIVSVFGAAPAAEKGAILLNLAAMLARAGSSVLVLDACPPGRGFCAGQDLFPGATLAQAARRECPLEDAVLELPSGVRLAVLGASGAPPGADALFARLARQADVVLVDAEAGAAGELPLAAMRDGEFVVQASPGPQGIMAAYAIVKRLHASLGRRPFGVLVTGAAETAARQVFGNMAQAATRYLGVELHCLGWVPPDEHMERAARLGRPVVEAFPLAGASVAFRHLAGRFARDTALLEA